MPQRQINGSSYVDDFESLIPLAKRYRAWVHVDGAFGLLSHRAAYITHHADARDEMEEVIAGIVASGEAFFGGTTWRGKRAMRVSVCNWRTSPEDVRRSINSVARVLGVNPV